MPNRTLYDMQHFYGSVEQFIMIKVPDAPCGDIIMILQVVNKSPIVKPAQL